MFIEIIQIVIPVVCLIVLLIASVKLEGQLYDSGYTMKNIRTDIQEIKRSLRNTRDIEREILNGIRIINSSADVRYSATSETMKSLELTLMKIHNEDTAKKTIDK